MANESGLVGRGSWIVDTRPALMKVVVGRAMGYVRIMDTTRDG